MFHLNANLAVYLHRAVIDSYQYLLALLVALPAAQTADDYEALLP